jgi:two-component system invasion response regulator UvrY
MKILIADDHPVVRSGLKQLLAAERDMEVIGEATTGKEALDLVRSLEWDVSILDYSMPGSDGLSLLKQIKQEYPARPVLVLSVHSEDLHAREVLKAGGDGYIGKERSDTHLKAAIRKVAKGGKYISPELAEKLAVELGPHADKPLHDTLSDREYRVMWLLANGKQINQIARELNISPSTVSTYRTRILEKLGLTSNAALVRFAISHGLVE